MKKSQKPRTFTREILENQYVYYVKPLMLQGVKEEEIQQRCDFKHLNKNKQAQGQTGIHQCYLLLQIVEKKHLNKL